MKHENEILNATKQHQSRIINSLVCWRGIGRVGGVADGLRHVEEEESVRKREIEREGDGRESIVHAITLRREGGRQAAIYPRVKGCGGGG